MRLKPGGRVTNVVVGEGRNMSDREREGERERERERADRKTEVRQTTLLCRRSPLSCFLIYCSYLSVLCSTKAIQTVVPVE